MAVIGITERKSVLVKSGIADYAVNPYTGCLHGCVYCYARFMKRFTGHAEAWGQFVDAKVNAPEVLTREVRRRPKGEVSMSSVCDGWQPPEQKFRLARECLRILVEAGFQVRILTKSSLVARDFDIIEGYPDAEVGFTVTAADENVRRKIEPAASPTRSRIDTLEEAQRRGIRTWAFCGPLLPGLSDTEENIDELFRQLAELDLGRIYVDKLNRRWGVWPSVLGLLRRQWPELIETYRGILFDPEYEEEYTEVLARRIMQVADHHRLAGKVRCIFC